MRHCNNIIKAPLSYSQKTNVEGWGGRLLKSLLQFSKYLWMCTASFKLVLKYDSRKLL